MNNKRLYNDVINSGIDANICCDIAKNSQFSTNDNSIMYNYVRKVMLNNIVDAMYKKFGNSGIDNINFYIANGNNKYITRLNNARSLTDVFNNNDIVNFFNDIGVDNIYDYADIGYFNNRQIVR